jgi:hypothetical protein
MFTTGRLLKRSATEICHDDFAVPSELQTESAKIMKNVNTLR